MRELNRKVCHVLLTDAPDTLVIAERPRGRGAYRDSESREPGVENLSFCGSDHSMEYTSVLKCKASEQYDLQALVHSVKAGREVETRKSRRRKTRLRIAQALDGLWRPGPRERPTVCKRRQYWPQCRRPRDQIIKIAHSAVASPLWQTKSLSGHAISFWSVPYGVICDQTFRLEINTSKVAK